MALLVDLWQVVRKSCATWDRPKITLGKCTQLHTVLAPRPNLASVEHNLQTVGVEGVADITRLGVYIRPRETRLFFYYCYHIPGSHRMVSYYANKFANCLRFQ